MPSPGLLSLSPTGSTNLGNVTVGNSAFVVFTATNYGGGNLQVNSITAPGAEWSLSGLPSLPAVVVPGGSFQFTLTLTPVSGGAKSTTVSVNYSNKYGNQPALTDLVSAIAIIAGGAAFIPAALGFPITQVNQASSALQTSIKNTTGAPFQVTALTFASCIASPVFTGIGLNDMSSLGAYTGSYTSGVQTYTIIIDGNGAPDTFKWKLGAGAFTAGVGITGTAQTLSNGVEISFVATTGHTIGDQWIVVVTPPDGTEYLLTPKPTLPFTVAAGASQPIFIKFYPRVTGYLTDSFIAITDLEGTIYCPLQGICQLVVPVAICVNNTQQLVVGGYDSNGLQGKPAPLASIAGDYNGDQAGSLIFNGALWEALGEEKTLFRLGFYYENLGVAVLTGTLTVFRPQGGVDNFQTVPFSITLGTALADKTTRYEEVDVVATGEIITLSLSRGVSSGPNSICAIVPFFEPRGEKVRAS